MKINSIFTFGMICSVSNVSPLPNFVQNTSGRGLNGCMDRGYLAAKGSSQDTYADTSANEYSWQKYQKEKNYVRQFKKYGILYKTSILTTQEFNTVKRELSSLPLNLVKETTSSVAHNRIGAQLPSNCEINKVLSNPNGSFIRLMNELAFEEDVKDGRNGMILSQKVPVEIRIYEQQGAGMEWHKDDILYEPEQIEVVFTVENYSDCATQWEEESVQETRLRKIESEANSAIILKAGPSGARHSVSALKSGRRVILKFVFIRKDAKFLEETHSNIEQFASKKGKKRKTKKRKR